MNYLIQLLLIRETLSSKMQIYQQHQLRLNYYLPYAYLYSYSSDYSMSPLCYSRANFNDFYASTFLSQIKNHSYKTSERKNIILQKQVAMNKTKMPIQTQTKKTKKIKKTVVKKICQKQSRNVVSNLLRIFFKNILQLRYYEVLIDKSLRKINADIRKSEFYTWLISFNINFKNYIRFTQIKKIFTQSGSSTMQMILRIILNHYLKNYSISHCLTSKRIEKKSTKMHLEGLKSIAEQFLNIKALTV